MGTFKKKLEVGMASVARLVKVSKQDIANHTEVVAILKSKSLSHLFIKNKGPPIKEPDGAPYYVIV